MAAMDRRNCEIIIAYNNSEDIFSRITDCLSDVSSDIRRRIVYKQLSRSEDLLVLDEELIGCQTLVAIGVSVTILKEFNRRIRSKESLSHLRLIFADIHHKYLYLFVNFGLNDKHLSFEECLRETNKLLIVTDDNQICDRSLALSPFVDIISGLICGQLLSTSLNQTKQLFYYEIDPQLFDNKLGTDRQIVIIGLGSLGFKIVKQLVRIGVKNLILIDSDSIHKYNLRLDLFEKSDIGIKKCEVVKRFIENTSKDIQRKVEIFFKRVQELEPKFWESVSKDNAIIISAMDNTESKRFLNRTCLHHTLPFIDVGIDGHMFHIQPIVPHLTESYFVYSDPFEVEYPLCVVKSFPQTIEHCVQWSKTKFDNWFNRRAKRADDWVNCLQSSRLIFEKFFNRKAKQMLFSLPIDRKNENGTDFWSDKRRPHSLDFDLNNNLHKSFVILCSKLIANVNQIEIPSEEELDIKDVINSVVIPEFVPKTNLVIETDPSLPLTTRVPKSDITHRSDQLKAQTYSRDNENHLLFIHILVSLRAEMYGIETVPISEVNRIFNRIIKCFDSTLITASAMVSIELMKLVHLGSDYHNCLKERQTWLKNVNHFYNLSDLDSCVTSEPSQPKRIQLSECYSFTEWDYWTIYESDGISTLEDVLKVSLLRAGSPVSSIFAAEDSKAVYVPQLFPNHLKRRQQTIREIVFALYQSVPTNQIIFDVSFDTEVEETFGPTLKYVFSN